jgi:hypothetical protein
MTVSDILNPPSGTVSGRGDDGEYSETGQPEQRRCECGSAYYDGAQWVTRYLSDSTEPDDPKEIIVPVAHCPGECGCRLSVVDGEPVVGPSVAKLLAALALELSDHGDCPMDYSDWPCPAAPETHDCEGGPVELCWLLYYGLAATYADAQALWARMEDAAK